MKHRKPPFLLATMQGLFLAALLALPAAAQAADLELKTEAFQDIVVKGKDGKTEKQRKTVTSAVPGSEIIYVITYRNNGKKPAEKVIVNNPVPAGLAYQAGSAQGNGARAEVSVDGGKTFGALEAQRVKDAKGVARAAKGSDVTHVRWTVLAPVPAGQGGTVTYRAMVR
ncbi:MAG: conserved repeat domain [Moraxellaceae bacterium]|jgi:uncharacterized repeat protein (TIGR01451 family)|nr:conserved repeat domain [Moraxellaceae bacterium]